MQQGGLLAELLNPLDPGGLRTRFRVFSSLKP